VGSEADVVHAMIKVGRYPANPITFESSLRIAVDTVLRRPDDEAPVSPALLVRVQAGLGVRAARRRGPAPATSVRFWRWDKLLEEAPVWFGSATFDQRVGLSYTTGQVTHHMGPNTDAERDVSPSSRPRARSSESSGRTISTRSCRDGTEAAIRGIRTAGSRE
jgi:hypothetical protein